MSLQSYKELIVWQKAIDLVVGVYALTKQFPKEETYGLSSQMRRSAISIPSNIAEGQRRKDLPEYLHFLRISDASSAELETQIIIAKRLYSTLDYSKIDGLLEEVQKMLNVLMSRLEANLKPKTQNLKPKRTGYIAITTSIILSILILIIAITLGSASLFSRNNNLNFSFKQTGYYVAKSCLDYALLQLALNSSYAGNEIQAVDSYQCAVLAVETAAPNKIIRATSTIQGIATNLKLTVDATTLSTVSLEEAVKF